MAASRVCRTVIADDHGIVRDATRRQLGSIPGVEIVGEADNGVTTIALLKRLHPDLLVLDIAMPHASGVVVLGEARRWSPLTRIAVLTGVKASGVLADVVASGVAGVMSKGIDSAELRAGFEAIVAGGTYVSGDIAMIIEAARGLRALTARERQVLSLAIQGKSNTEIAALLGISDKTVDNHRTSLMRKLEVHSTSELVALALREGLVDSISA
jgi:DNA-binding NarL/FixJ family response regulator